VRQSRFAWAHIRSAEIEQVDHAEVDRPDGRAIVVDESEAPLGELAADGYLF
jgi:hypothetical protein